MSMLGLGGLPARRPDQQYRPGGQGVTPGARSIGLFRLVIVYGSGKTGIFDYSGKPGPGNPPVLSMVPPGVTADPYGNAILPLLTVQNPATRAYTNLQNGLISFGSSAADTHPATIGPAGGGQLIMSTGLTGLAGDVAGGIAYFSSVLSVSGNNPTLCIAPNVPSPVTGALLEVQGELAIALSAAGTAFLTQLAADLNARFTVSEGGAHAWGPGSAGTDTRLYRSAAGVLAVDQLAANKAGVAESWQSMTTRGYQNAWADSGINPPGRFRLIPSPGGMVQVQGSLSTPLNPPDNQVVLNLPNAYHPAATFNNFTGRCIVPSNATVQVRFNITSTGNLTVAGASALAAGTEVVIPGGAMYSLD